MTSESLGGEFLEFWAPASDGNAFAHSDPLAGLPTPQSHSSGDSFEQFREGEDSQCGAARPADHRPRVKATTNGTQEKNRKAQARYRQRQKEKMDDYKQTVDRLNQQLEDMKMEKARLESQNRLLQKVARNKQELEGQIAAFAPAAQQSRASKEEQLEAVMQLLSDFIKVVSPNMPSHVDARFLRNADERTHAQFRKIYNTELAKCLANGGDVVGSPAHLRLVELIEGKHKIMLGMAATSSRLWREISRNSCNCGSQGPLPTDLWRRVVATMQLSPVQKAHLLDARRNLLLRIQDIVRQRRRIVAVLQVAVPCIDQLEHKNAVSFVQASQAADELQANLESEHQAVSQFVREVFCSEVIDPVQEARGKVEADPFVWDTLAVCGEVAAEAGEPTQMFSEARNYFGQYDQPSAAPAVGPDAAALPDLDLDGLLGLPADAELADAPSLEGGWLTALGQISSPLPSSRDIVAFEPNLNWVLASQS
ncbi:hypothetical protein WJX72_010687 [[Myrmecia] bisecta]|uniref:BZIP domain-containing protein n=1 Tax=[Myrmecia] bisecta TaxID=41462 RepID=A0AAW1QC40_9CHLO